MALQFYLGRAGSGKTRRCLDEIAERLRKDPTPRGANLIWLLPEQATAQAEAAILGAPGIRGFARARVVSFKRLAGEVLRETGGGARDFLDEQGRLMLLRSLVARHQEQLLVFGQSARESGFIARLARAFAELAQFRHTFDDLHARRRDLETRGLGESLLARKLHDIELLGRAWKERLSERFADSDHFLDELAARLEQSSFFEGAEVWVDGFASFMPQELRVLEAILRRAADVRVALLLDPEEIGALPTRADGADPLRLFNQSEETFLRLRALAFDADVPIAEPLCLPAEGQPTRFDSSEPLGRLEANLTRCGMLGSGRENEALGRQEELEAPPESLALIVCVEAAGRREEVEAVARAIRRLCREEGHRYRDVAVVLRDLEPYHALIRSIFERYEIPFFLDRRRGIAHHPLVELLRSSIRVLTGGWRDEDVVHYLKTDFAPVSRREADQIENLALAQGWRGNRWWAAPTEPESARETQERSLDRARLAAFEPLLDLRQALAPVGEADRSRLGSAQLVEGIVQFLKRLGCAETLEKWTREAREAGRLDEADEHEQAWQGVASLLREMARVLEGEEMTLGDWADALETGLGNLTLGLVPPALDQVLVGTIERSRQPTLLSVFVIGFNDGIFPAQASEDVILSDAERQTLREVGAMELAPVSPVRLFRERLLGYIALTRASRRLWVSYAAADSTGKALRPSPYLSALLECAADGAKVGDFRFVRLGSEWLEERVESVERAGGALEGVVRARQREMARAAPERLEAWLALGDRLARAPEVAARLERAMRALHWKNRPSLEQAPNGEGLAAPMSVSRLERYAECPFQYFARYGLTLREREEFEVGALDVGVFHHAVLSLVFELLLERCGVAAPARLPAALTTGGRALDWGEVAPEEAERALEEALERCRGDFLSEGPLGEAQVGFFVSRSRRLLLAALRAFIQQGTDDRFRQSAAELDFGFAESALPALGLGQDSNVPVTLRGKIDRLDIAPLGLGGAWSVRVIDFKSSSKRLNLQDVLEGLALQLPIYLSVAIEAGPKHLRPAGAFFLPIARAMRSAKAPPLESGEIETLEDEATAQDETLKARGVFDADAMDLFGPIEPGGKSPYVSLRVKKDGTLAHGDQDDWVPSGALERLCRRAEQAAAKSAQGIAQGIIDVRPVLQNKKAPCAQCPYGDVCRIDPRSAEHYRRIRPLSRTEVFELL